MNTPGKCYARPAAASRLRTRIQLSFKFSRPVFWATWIGLGAMRLLALLPYCAQLRVGAGLGSLIRSLPLAYVRIARRNLELCLPGLSAAQRASLVNEHCRNLGVGICETAVTWWSSNASVSRRADIQGMEHLTAALAKGRGAILVGGHFTTIEIATRILGTVVPLNVVFRPPKNELLAYIMRRSFERHGKPNAHTDIRTMIRALKNNEAVWYAPDQSYRNKGAAMVDFFGVPAATNTVTSRLARISGAAVLTYFPERLPGNAGYRVTIGPAFENFPGVNPVSDAERFNRLLETHILKVPAQYLWMHRRFKGLCAQYPDYYGRDSRQAASSLSDSSA
jgi:KDO2-lipid IV(A) lauroyltransferase